MARTPLGIVSDAPSGYPTKFNKREQKLAEAILENQNIEDDFQQAFICSESNDADGTVYTGGAADQKCGFHSGIAAYELHIEAVAGTPTAVYPYKGTTAGLKVINDATNGFTDFEITNGNSTSSKSCYTVGSFPEGKTVYFETQIKLTDATKVTGLWAGWRNVETYNAPAAYDTYATIYKDGSENINTSVEIDAGGANTDDTSLNWANDTTYTLKVEVDNNGATRMYVNGTEYLASPVHTWTAADTIIPFVALDCESTTAGFIMLTWVCGTK
jgi:hypothetical protein